VTLSIFSVLYCGFPAIVPVLFCDSSPWPCLHLCGNEPP
jgi:hypothetical protein